jgi:D-alanyl-D-alanine carboxypeptidase
LGKKVVRNYNTLLGRYAGTDGMKTGFICASGFNLVATATRDGRHLIAVVLGAPSSAMRAVKAAQLLEQGFNSGPLSWLTPSLGNVDSLTPVDAAPANLHEEMCGPHRKRPAAEDEEEEANAPSDSPYAAFLSSLRPQTKGASLLQEANLGEPVVVYTGPTRDPGSQIAATDPKPAKPPKVAAVKPGPNAPARSANGGPAVANASAVPWTAFSPAALSTSPPADANAGPGDSRSAVPLPRARPKIVSSKPPPVAKNQ